MMGYSFLWHKDIQITHLNMIFVAIVTWWKCADHSLCWTSWAQVPTWIFVQASPGSWWCHRVLITSRPWWDVRQSSGATYAFWWGTRRGAFIPMGSEFSSWRVHKPLDLEGVSLLLFLSLSLSLSNTRAELTTWVNALMYICIGSSSVGDTKIGGVVRNHLTRSRDY